VTETTSSERHLNPVPGPAATTQPIFDAFLAASVPADAAYTATEAIRMTAGQNTIARVVTEVQQIRVEMAGRLDAQRDEIAAYRLESEARIEAWRQESAVQLRELQDETRAWQMEIAARIEAFEAKTDARFEVGDAKYEELRAAMERLASQLRWSVGLLLTVNALIGGLIVTLQ